MNLWSKAENPVTGEQFENFLKYFNHAHNGTADIEAFTKSEYGAEFARRLDIRFRLEVDPGGEAEQRYYASLGLKKEYYETEDFYTRWFIVSPLSIPDGALLPLIIANHGHGNPIEAEEYAFGFGDIAAKEGFMFAMAQNTNPENICRILGIIGEKYPVDMGRVYVAGYSQGGQQVSELLMYAPELFAGAAPCGFDVFKTYDKFFNKYTKAQYEHLKDTFVPFMQVVGACEHLNLVPLSTWTPRKVWTAPAGEKSPRPEEPAPKDIPRDPTDAYDGAGRKLPAPFESPGEGEDPTVWRLGMLNGRLRTLGCEERDEERCRAILSGGGENEVQNILGIYADEERTEYHYGYRHYVADIRNSEGFTAFRYVAVENSPHWVPASTAELIWDFFKHFRRDSVSGKIIEE